MLAGTHMSALILQGPVGFPTPWEIRSECCRTGVAEKRSIWVLIKEQLEGDPAAEGALREAGSRCY